MSLKYGDLMRKIAIIGTGISGLTAAYLLNRKYEITIFEKNDYIGGHTGFEESEIKPETGKLLVFSNSIYKHHVTKIEESERFALNIWYNRK